MTSWVTSLSLLAIKEDTRALPGNVRFYQLFSVQTIELTGNDSKRVAGWVTAG